MSDHTDTLDGVIDETLREMTAGSPRQGVRVRVLARIDGASAPEPATPLWLGGRLRLAALQDPLAVLAIIGIVAALAVPQLLRRSQAPPRPAQQLATNPTSESRSPLVAAVGGSTAARSGAGTAVRPARSIVPSPKVETARARLNASTRDANRVSGGWSASPAVDADTEAADAIIAPLGDPIPITDRPIDITSLVITPIATRAIEIPLIEDRWPSKGPGQVQ